MPNKPNLARVVDFPKLHDEATIRYIDGFGVMLEGFGAGATFGRLLGYRLLMPAPVSLDQMARDLQASKSSVSVAARMLEQSGMARRLPQRGSRRLLYEAAETCESL